jgi:hypothetical protein
LLHQDTADSLPADVTDFLDGTGLASKIGETVQLTAVDDAGWPRMTLLSAGEVVAPHSRKWWPRTLESSGFCCGTTAGPRALTSYTSCSQ